MRANSLLLRFSRILRCWHRPEQNLDPRSTGNQMADVKPEVLVPEIGDGIMSNM